MIRYTNPDIRVEFTSVSGDKFETGTIEFGGLVLAIQTVKRINTLPGMFTITMVGKNNFIDFFDKYSGKTSASPFELFRPAGFVKIEINGKQKMQGMIDVVSKQVSMGQNGKPTRIYTITGRDLGALLIEHKVWYDDVLYKNREKQTTFTRGLSVFGVLGGKPGNELIEQIVNTWMIGVVNQEIIIDGKKIKAFEYSKEKTQIFGDKMQDKFIATTTDKSQVNPLSVRVFDGESDNVGKEVASISEPGCLSSNVYANEYDINIAMSAMQGSLSNFIGNYAGKPFNELFVETGDTDLTLSTNENVKLKKNLSYLVFRPTPWDDDNFEIEGINSKSQIHDMKTYSINDEVIQAKNLSMSKNQKSSTYFVKAAQGNIGLQLEKIMTPGAYDEESLRRYGYNPMTVSLGGYETSKKSTGSIESQLSEFQNKLKSWYIRDDQSLYGSFTIKGNELARIGNKLNYNRTDGGNGSIEDDYEEGYYYITGVIDDWKYGESYKTTLEVGRGISKKIFKKETNKFNINQSTIELGYA